MSKSQLFANAYHSFFSKFMVFSLIISTFFLVEKPLFAGEKKTDLQTNHVKKEEGKTLDKSILLNGNGIYTINQFKSQKEVDIFIAECKKMKVNKIFVETKQTDGRLLYPSKKFPNIVSESVGEFDSFGAICKAAHKENMTVHAWFVTFNEGYKNPVPIIKEHPEYLIVHRDGKTCEEQPVWSTVDPKYATNWVCPTAKGYRDYLKEMFQEVIDLYNVDGIHLDYIRYPEEVNAREYCYCERCKDIYKKNYGYTLPKNDVIKERYRVTQMCDNVANAVKDFSEFVHSQNKFISAYVFTDYPTAIEAAYQDWPWFSQYLDFIIPTSYEVSPSYIAQSGKRTKAVLDKNCIFFPTIYSGPNLRRGEDGGKRWYKGTPDDIISTFKAWLEQDVEGVVFFTYEKMYDLTLLTDEQREKNINKIEKISKEYFNK